MLCQVPSLPSMAPSDSPLSPGTVAQVGVVAAGKVSVLLSPQHAPPNAMLALHSARPGPHHAIDARLAHGHRGWRRWVVVV
eukprot:CAMPEP_0175830024 /NCGR_PEP_ID=MMETSP0107_2-20121207/13693_1 /TAXON_ID=195067 ORGANISM="Goniomonas pacifica, Strain CCMP1869" /NCGR_SAMPLE_ID=MMETSP0107_2 /ASSEMBLY_ACC=CAM_ASM_000203 /LENGTH=80 /DNA_ID=CAMNT_0017142933 /DNA_START=30 /DNA_END=270 /DNA_ORIENTATION=-